MDLSSVSSEEHSGEEHCNLAGMPVAAVAAAAAAAAPPPPQHLYYNGCNWHSCNSRSAE
jgi:hypothetical protein